LKNAEEGKADRMGLENPILNRKKRVNRLKKIICISLVGLLILPTFLCVVMFQKLLYLQSQVDILMVNSYGTTYGEGKNKIKAQIAGNNPSNEKIDNNNKLFFEENLYIKAEEYAASLEDSKGNEYNVVESTKKEKVEQNGQDEKNDLNPDKKELTVENKTKISDVRTLSMKNADKKVDSNLSNKKVYLTFDDGPSSFTDEILDILGEYNVKATFFVIGKTDKESKRLYQRIVNEGHTLGMHSFSHDYQKIYKSLEDFEKDFTKLRNLLYDTTGYFPTIYRFPGGSGNDVSGEDVSVFIEYLNKESVVYYDWNVINGDATGKPLTAKESYDNILNGVKLHNRSIVLMHDTNKKESTVHSLKNILKTLTDNNAKLLPLNDDVIPIQQVSNSSKELNK
jgi:peptidoglycan/xylan/chitin deacetylase (PgdA/CDA1 family)